MSKQGSKEGSEYGERMRSAAADLRVRALASYSSFLSSPDEKSGEQWDAGQLLAHTAEFGPYWVAQAQVVVDAPIHPASFGRIKSDPERIAAIERDRARDPLSLLDQVDAWVVEASAWHSARTLEQLALTGRHSTLGEMSVGRIIEHFCVEHLEEHAAQLSQ